ncbi:MAG: glycerol-3-phosphate dehydrogenase (NAD(P)+) [Candidatus Tokpelaia sp. JSC188]|nr:MAG: glycerol-3-phosphate dehydrogenase (NAD(P)+) [Candidatus Tokpelaia sp. JSC188]
MKMQKKHVAILGCGAWGTALAALTATLGHDVYLYGRKEKTVEEINTKHQNIHYLPDISLPDTIKATSDPRKALASANIILVGIPSQAFAFALKEFVSFIPTKAPLVLCNKGIEQVSGRFMSDVVQDILPCHPLAVLSGPGFARDVARGLPTAVTIASRDKRLAHDLACLLSGRNFRCYASTDLIGVQIGGALKNVLALVSGMVMGLKLGVSAQAALITRGFAELRRLGVKLGGKLETMTGLSVLGDVILTCSSLQSRNYTYGAALGAGQPLTDLLLAEGVATASAASRLCEKYGINAPIIHTTAAILSKNMHLKDALQALITRPVKFED